MASATAGSGAMRDKEEQPLFGYLFRLFAYVRLMLWIPASIFWRAEGLAECTMILGGSKSCVATASSIQRITS
jgi:hypothetical protein